MRRTRQITIETHSITVIRTNSRRLSAHCEHCRKTVSAFTPEQTAMFLRLNIAEVCRRVETKQIHLTHNGRGAALICSNSIADEAWVAGFVA